MAKKEKGTVEDWAAKAARQIQDEVYSTDRTVSQSRLAAIIVTFLKPALDLLQPREHYHCDDSWYCCGACVHPDHGELSSANPDRIPGKCNCEAEEWNNKVRKALS
jgi:hypothetical protein